MAIRALRTVGSRQAIPAPGIGKVPLLWRCFAVLGLTVYQSAFTETFRFLRGDDRLLAGQSEISNTICQVILLFGLIFGLKPYIGRLKPILRDLRPYVAILVLCFISTLWSPFPGLTIRRSGTLTICLFFGIWCYLRFGMPSLLRLLGQVTAVLGAISIVVYFAIPNVGHETALGYSTAMRGVYSQKNTLGAAMLLGITCYLYAIVRSNRLEVGAWMIVAFLLGCEVLALSATSTLISVAAICLTVLMLARANWRIFVLLVAVGAGSVGLLAVALVVAPDVIFAVIGRDPDFTGRLPLWIISLHAAAQRPLLGYGYSGFWTEDSTLVQYIWQVINWQAPSAHNGYIDILLQIGVIGLAIYMYMWGRIIYFAWLSKSQPAMSISLWILLFMFVNVMLNTDEGPLPYPDQFTMLMPGTMVMMEAWRRRSTIGPEVRRARLRRSIPHAVVADGFPSL